MLKDRGCVKHNCQNQEAFCNKNLPPSTRHWQDVQGAAVLVVWAHRQSKTRCNPMGAYPSLLLAP